MDKEQGAGGAVEPEKVEGEEGTPEEGAPTEPETPSDPLDAIEDEEERNKAKAARAIERRNAKKAAEDEAAKAAETPQPETAYATKADLERMAMNEAKKQLAPEVVEVWDELTNVPLGGYDPLDATSIAKNMAKRYLVYRQDNPLEGHDPSKDLLTTPQNSYQPGKQPEKKSEASLPGYKEPVSPENWYPEKE